MKKLLLVVIALFATFVWAQTGSSGSSQDQKTDTSTQAKKGTHKKGGETTIAGCLSGPNSEGAYVLKHGKKEVEVGGSDELSKHVGHEVKLHGTWAKSGEAIGEKEGAEKGEAKEGKKGEAGERHFQVTSIDHVSDTCPAAGAASEKGEMGEHKHHHKGAAAGEAAPSASPAASPSPSPQK